MRHWTIRRTAKRQQQQTTINHPMDTLTSTHSIVQMSDSNLTPAEALKKHCNDHHHHEEDEVDENQQNNSLKRKHPNECGHEISSTMKNHNELPHTQQQQQNGLYEQKIRKLANDSQIDVDHDANYLKKFCENHSQDDKIDRKVCTNDTILLNGNGSSNGNAVNETGAGDLRSERVIIKGQRRTRALSTDSIQTDCYDTRKQLELQSNNIAASEVSVYPKIN